MLFLFKTGPKRMKALLVILSMFILVPSASAITYNCKVTRKFAAADETLVYTPEHLKRFQFGVVIEFDEHLDDGYKNAVISRCGYSYSADMVTCDKYDIDFADKHFLTNKIHYILKFYHFSSHFDVQLFSNNTFIENNGRGSIASGKCVT